MLIFGNHELPSQIIQHLPNIKNHIKPKGNFEEIINDLEDKPNLTKDRCLIVDDEPFNIDSLKICLQCATVDVPNFNFKERIDTAYNGLNALEVVKKRYQEGYNFKFIMMDCNMPKMDGYEATKQIRKFISEIQMDQPIIVAISGHVEEKYIDRAKKAGMNTLVPKPAKVEDIRDIVKDITFGN